MLSLPKVCSVIAAPSGEEVLTAARRLAPAAERFVEVRLDYLADASPAGAIVRDLRRSRIPVLATLRSRAAGGHYEGTAELQLGLLEECSRAGAAIVDLEVESAERLGAEALAGLRRSGRLLISFHDFHGTPCDLNAVVARLRRFPAAFYKIVTTSTGDADNARVLALYDRARRPAGGRAALIAFAMGELGKPTRVLSLARGAPFTYAAPDSANAVAPGQMNGDELLRRFRAAQLSSETAVYGVIGNPISHSISPAVHNAAFAAIRRNAVYLPFRVESLPEFLNAIPAYRLSGFSITMPHKEAMARAADWVDSAARDVGAINTVVVRNHKLRGYNTDMTGITVPLEKRLRLSGARVLVAGTGGAARAAVFALARARARVFVTGRRPDQAQALAEQAGAEAIERGELSGAEFDAIVHATPLGMTPDTASCFFTATELNTRLLFETVYTPAETKLTALARARRIDVIPGVEMFVEQAAGQFELWSGRKAPRSVIEQAARTALYGR